MKNDDIISITQVSGPYFAVRYRQADGTEDVETVQALDTNEAFIVFRNLMIARRKQKDSNPARK